MSDDINKPIDTTDAPAGYRAAELQSRNDLCVGCAFAAPFAGTIMCTQTSDAVDCLPDSRKDGHYVIFVKETPLIDRTEAPPGYMAVSPRSPITCEGCAFDAIGHLCATDTERQFRHRMCKANPCDRETRGDGRTVIFIKKEE